MPLVSASSRSRSAGDRSSHCPSSRPSSARRISSARARSEEIAGPGGQAAPPGGEALDRAQDEALAALGLQAPAVEVGLHDPLEVVDVEQADALQLGRDASTSRGTAMSTITIGRPARAVTTGSRSARRRMAWGASVEEMTMSAASSSCASRSKPTPRPPTRAASSRAVAHGAVGHAPPRGPRGAPAPGRSPRPSSRRRSPAPSIPAGRRSTSSARLDGHRRHRGRPRGDARLGAHLLAHLQRLAEEPVEHRARGLLLGGERPMPRAPGPGSRSRRPPSSRGSRPPGRAAPPRGRRAAGSGRRRARPGRSGCGSTRLRATTSSAAPGSTAAA